MKMRYWVLACGMAWAVHASALEVYQWVDEDGITHVSDKVPNKYRKSARVIQVLDYGPSKPSTPQPASPPNKTSAPTMRLEAPTSTQPTQPDNASEKLDCDALWREYQSSQECFAPYRVVGGGLKAEAFEHCKELPNPSSKCGIPSN